MNVEGVSIELGTKLEDMNDQEPVKQDVLTNHDHGQYVQQLKAQDVRTRMDRDLVTF